jgi:protein phosphatase
MTANRKWKRKVRARAAKTGESYTAALRYLRSTEEAHMRSYEVVTAGLTDIGRVRESNEDHLLAEGDLFVVADGMGGSNRGALASRLAVDTVRDAFSNDQTADGLVAAVSAANEAVYQRRIEDPDDKNFGTTIAAVAMVADGDREMLVSVNVGDSRVYLFRDDHLQRLSSDHSRVGDLVRAGALSETEAKSHPERHILTQAIGVDAEVTPYVEQVIPANGDRILLCSDGLFNDLSSAEISRHLTAGDAEAAASILVAAAIEAGGEDNITAVVVDVRAA